MGTGGVVRRGRERVLGGEPVLGQQHARSGRCGDRSGERAVPEGRSGDVAAAVEVPVIPFVGRQRDGCPMTNSAIVVADLRLRGGAGTVSAQLRWPVPGPLGVGLLVLLPAQTTDPALADRLCRCGSGLLVLVARCRTPSDAVSTVEWAADHATDLGVAGSPVALVGDGPGGALAVAVARHAAAAGWPAVDPLVLIDPPDPADPADPVRAHLLDRRGGGDVVTDLITLLEGTNR